MFDKNGVERKMFADFYKMCEDFWIPEDSDEYWKSVSEAADNFVRKYKNVHPMAYHLSVAFVCGLEDLFRE